MRWHAFFQIGAWDSTNYFLVEISAIENVNYSLMLYMALLVIKVKANNQVRAPDSFQGNNYVPYDNDVDGDEGLSSSPSTSL